jgi:tetratricopeptide (TPR) repeat protein
MFRLPIVILSLFLSTFCWGQTSIRELKFKAQSNKEQGDYIEASLYFDSILQRDSSNLDVLSDYSDVLIQSKNFYKAKIIIEKLTLLDAKHKTEPNSSLKLGLIYKQLGDYEKAINTFSNIISNKIKVDFPNIYNKANREIESCNWAIENLKDTLKYTLNKIHGIASKDSEFGHSVIGSQLIISSLKCANCDTINGFLSENYTNKLYAVNKNTGKNLKEIKSLNSTVKHSANGSFNHDKTKFYYSSCSTKNNRCKILVSNYKKGVWSVPDTLVGEINSSEATYTMPATGKINNTEYLFFCSDNKNSLGGLDVFYGQISDKLIDQVKPITYINSVEDEISPFFDDSSSTLYFSSSWHNGYGGFDLFKTQFQQDIENGILNLGIPFNSPNNDTYLIKDSLNYYVTSNRNHTATNKTCCSDIYLLKPIINNKVNTIPIVSKSDSLNLIAENVRKTNSIKNISELERLIPVSIYFHNDIPNPRTLDSITQVNYLETYTSYNQLLPIYQQKYTFGTTGNQKELSKKDITSFFLFELQNGKKELDEFLEILEIELANGASFDLLFKGYASPLSQSYYNKILSKRRISSVRNYIAFYKNGALLKYMIAENGNNARLQIKEEPFGEYKTDKAVSDNPNDQKNSIYSKKAALERKVEIIGFKIR